MARSDPTLAHHLRFARTLALVSGLGASAAGCYAAHGITGDEVRPDAAAPDAARHDAAPVDAAVADAGRDAPVTCDTCSCSWESPPPGTSCEELGAWTCCAAVGPLAPPDLAV